MFSLFCFLCFGTGLFPKTARKVFQTFQTRNCKNTCEPAEPLGIWLVCECFLFVCEHLVGIDFVFVFQKRVIVQEGVGVSQDGTSLKDFRLLRELALVFSESILL